MLKRGKESLCEGIVFGEDLILWYQTKRRINEKVSIKQFPGDQNMKSKEQEKNLWDRETLECESCWVLQMVGSLETISDELEKTLNK